MTAQKRDTTAHTFQASPELTDRINKALENLHGTDLELDMNRLTKSTLLRLAVLEGLNALEKKYLKTKRTAD